MTPFGLLVAFRHPRHRRAGGGHAWISTGILPPHVTLSHPGPSLWVSAYPPPRRTQTLDQGPPQTGMGSSSLTYTCEGPISKKGHIPRYQDVNASLGEHNSTRKMP